VYVVANDEAQAQERVFDLIADQCRRMGLVAIGAATVTKSQVVFPETGTKIVAIATDYRERRIAVIRLGPRHLRWTRPMLREIRDAALDPAGALRAARRVAMAAAVLAAFAVGTSPASGKPYEHVRIDEIGSVILDDFCGDIRLGIDTHNSGVVVGRVTGQDGTLRYTVSNHGSGTFTNLDTGIALTNTWNYTDQDVRATDNGDGTISILTQSPGPEKFYGPDGQLIYTYGGTQRVLTVLDYGGTLTDPSDDTFVSETLVSITGGKPQPDLTFCDLLHTYTT
jgi:hypothetical protein